MSAKNPRFPAASTAPLQPEAETSSHQNPEIQSDPPTETFDEALERIRRAAWSVALLAKERLENKMSNHRENGVARELLELEKVLSRLGPRQSYRQSVIREKAVTDK